LFTTPVCADCKQITGQMLPDSWISNEYKNLSSLSLWEWEFYLGPVLLRDADQFSMAHSLEIREPLMDHEWVQFMLSLPDSVKYSSEMPKKLLVRAFEKELPPEVWNRKKMGFTFPMQEWMKNELRSRCKKNLTELDEKNIFEKDICTKLWNFFLNGHPLVPWTRIWHLVVLNEWMNRNKINA
jgi:asparagine synthase (glutamine-hydrolysing)